MSFGRRKNGQYYPKRPRINTSSPNPKKPSKRNSNSSNFGRIPRSNDIDNQRDREMEEFAEEIMTDWEERQKQERFERFSHEELGNAKILLISAVPTIISSDPTMTLATIWATWKFAKFSYDFAIRLNHEYTKTGNLETALLNMTLGEIEQHVLSKLKEVSIKNISEFIAQNLWSYYKEKNPTLRISIDLDKHIQNATIRTFEEVLNKVI